MKTTHIAFDVDGTLIKTQKDNEKIIIENNRITDLLKILSSFKNIKIIVWSGQGEKWAREVIEELMLEKYVDLYASKNHKGKDENGKHIFEPDIVPDICIDDIHSCNLGLINLIVKEK